MPGWIKVLMRFIHAQHVGNLFLLVDLKLSQALVIEQFQVMSSLPIN